MRDLVALVADKNMEYAIKGLLERPQDLVIRPIAWDVFVHPHRDPGCLNEAHDFLRPLAREYEYAMVLFDYQGCGREDEPPDKLAARVRGNLARNGWANRAEVVVLVPELEIWVWSNSPYVDFCLGWADQRPTLRVWLAKNGHWPADTPKPRDPKVAMETALRHVRQPRSSAIYLELARHASLQGHTEPAFAHFSQTLRGWFPQ